MSNTRILGVVWLLYYSVSTPLVDTFSEVVSTRFKGVSLILSSNEVSAICCMITVLIYIVFTLSSYVVFYLYSISNRTKHFGMYIICVLAILQKKPILCLNGEANVLNIGRSLHLHLCFVYYPYSTQAPNPTNCHKLTNILILG